MPASGPSDNDADLQETLFASKVDAFAQEYNHLLVSQLDSQRQYFEGLLRSQNAQRDAAEAQAITDSSQVQVKRAQGDVKAHLQAQKNAERRLVSSVPVQMMFELFVELWRPSCNLWLF